MGNRRETLERACGYTLKRRAAGCRWSAGRLKQLDPQGSLVIRGVLANSGPRRGVTPITPPVPRLTVHAAGRATRAHRMQVLDKLVHPKG